MVMIWLFNGALFGFVLTLTVAVLGFIVDRTRGSQAVTQRYADVAVGGTVFTVICLLLAVTAS